MKILILIVCVAAVCYICVFFYVLLKAIKRIRGINRRFGRRRSSFDSDLLVNQVSMPRVKRPRNNSQSRDTASDALMTATIVSSYDGGSYGSSYGCSGSSSSSDSSSSSCSSD